MGKKRKRKREKVSDAEAVMQLMSPIDGEVREVRRCNECGKLFGRRYIPYGLGQGLTVNPCICFCVDNNHKATVVLTRDP